MPTDINAYLATRYLAADTKPSKKRKRKHGGASSNGLLIQDDDASGWTSQTPGADDDDGPTVSNPTVAGTSAEFRKAKKSSWKTLGGGGNEGDAAAADAILSAAAAETAAAQAAAEDAPVVEGAMDIDDAAAADPGVVKMSDGTHAGLQSAKAVTAQLEKRRREEQVRYEEERAARAAAGLAEEEEQVYRDATGRRIDVSLRREQARRAALEAEDKARKAKEALKGEVQMEEARRRKELLEDAALMPLARRADDEEMNQEMKEQNRWNDPMAQFASEKIDGQGAGEKSKKGKGRPIYAGPAPPNRYSIRPGYRWDGVDRGNGFEADRFKALNRRERNKGLEYAWQTDE